MDYSSHNLAPQGDRLQQQVEVAEQTLISQRKSADSGKDHSGGIGVIFTGNIHHTIPHNLLLDPILSPVDKTLWMVMRASITNPKSPGYIPSRDELSTAMNTSRPTITRARNTLRIGRWMTYCRTVRDKKKRFLGDVYLLHEEPLSLEDTLVLDSGYIRFLEDQAAGTGASKNNRQFAVALLKEIDRLEAVPPSPTQLEMADHRISITANLPSEFKDDSLSAQFTNQARDMSEQKSQGKNLSLAQQPKTDQNAPEKPSNPNQGKNFSPGEASQVKNLSLAQSQVKKFAPASSSCSSSYINKYITYARACEDVDQDSDQKHDYQAMDASLPPDPDALGTGTLTGELHIRLEMADLGFLVTETTARKLHVWLGQSAHIPVLGRLIRRLPEAGQRLVGYQLFGRLIAELDPTSGLSPIRNLVGFAHRLAERYQSGEFELDEWGNRVREAVEEQEPWFLELGASSGST